MPDLLEIAAAHGCESLHLASDPASGMRAAIAVHSTVLGPALGGTRFRPYASEAEAVLDVCRLARGMTYKHAACGNDQGGGKAVLIGDPATLRSEDLLRRYGRFIDSLDGLYITAEDMGTTQADMDLLRRETRHVTGTSQHLGGSGDPSPATAVGVAAALGAVAERLWGDASLAGRHVLIVGTGKVGAALAGHAHEAGARLTLSDTRSEVAHAVAARYGAKVVDAELALGTECDILSPCAVGAVLSASAIDGLRCAAVCGAANNQLATEADGERLAQRGVLYVPDYIANAGGVINIAEEANPAGYDEARALERVRRIAGTVQRVFEQADALGITTAAAADRIAEARLAGAQRAS